MRPNTVARYTLGTRCPHAHVGGQYHKSCVARDQLNPSASAGDQCARVRSIRAQRKEVCGCVTWNDIEESEPHTRAPHHP